MKKTILLFAAMALGTASVSAQTQSTFFLDNYEYSYRLNAAKPSNRGFVGLGVSNIGVEANSNLGVSSLLFPTSKGVSTGFSPLVSTEDFLSKLNKGMNSFGEGMNENILTVAFWKGDKSFFNIELNVRQDLSADIPYDVFAMLKKGAGEYSFSNMRVDARAYAELALGYTHVISDQLSVGGRLKALIGLADAQMNINKADIKLNANNLSVDAQADMMIASPLVTMGTKDNDILDFNTLAFGKPGVGGFGATVDLGATYRPLDNLEISAAVNDLGFINWNYSLVGKSVANTAFAGVDVSGSNSLNGLGDQVTKELEEAMKALTTIVEFHKTSETVSQTQTTNWNANLGVRYWMPFYERLSVGALLSHHNTALKWNEARLGVTVTPIDQVSISGNMGVNTFGATWGAAANLSLGFLNLHIGVDEYMGPLAKITGTMVPLNKFNVCTNFGLTFMFGKSHNRMTR